MRRKNEKAAEIEREQDETKQRNVKGENTMVTPRPQEAVKDRLGAVEDQVREVKTNPNSGIGQRRDNRVGWGRLAVLGSGRLLDAHVCPGGGTDGGSPGTLSVPVPSLWK